MKRLILLLTIAPSALSSAGGFDARPSPRRARKRLTTSASLMLVVLYGMAVTGAAAIVLSTAGLRLGGTEALLFAVIFLAAILFSPVLHWARDMVDRHVFSSWLEREAQARAFVDRVATELHPNEIGRCIADELPSILGIEEAMLVLEAEVAEQWGLGEMPCVTGWPRQHLVAQVRRERTGVLTWPIVRRDGTVIGALCCGRKLDGRGFEPPEERTLQTVAEGVASALRTAESCLLLRQTQGELAEAERIASLGALAGGLAHEIKNPLASLKMGMYLLSRDGGAADRVRRIQSDVQRIDDLVSGLLRFTRDDVPETRTALDLCGLVRESVEGLSGLAADQGTRLTESYPVQPVVVHGSREQLRLVVNNLLANALQAAGDDGVVAVAVRDRGGLTEIEIRDSGPGAPTELQDRSFNWSFSTKPSGTGLGLALAKREAERVGGSIILKPANGQGTVVRLLLPRV